MTTTDCRKLAPGAAEVAELAELATILEPDVHVVTWRRPVDPVIHELVRRPEFQVPRDARTVVESSDVDLRAVVADLLPASVVELDEAAFEVFAADVAELCEAFADLVQARELMVSLEGPTEATCPRFHVDRVGIRMLVTYSGPGTQWLADEHVDRRWLGSPGADKPDEENGLMREGAVVRQVAPFAVTLLKGEAWPGNEKHGAVHRSPDPQGEPRVLLRVDMLSQLPVE